MPTKTAPICPVAAGTFLCGGQWYVGGAVGDIEVRPSWSTKIGCIRAVVIAATELPPKINDIDDGSSGSNIYIETSETVRQSALRVSVGASVSAGAVSAPVTFLSTLIAPTADYQSLKVEFSGSASNVTVSIFDWNPLGS